MSLFKDIIVPELNLTYNQPLGLFINNEFVKSSDDATIETSNPSTGEPIAKFYAASHKDIDNAVKAARLAYQETWSKTTPADRGILLSKLYDLINEHKDVIAAIDSIDSGKPYHTNALGDLEQILELTRYFSGASDKYVKGQYIPVNNDKYALVVREPFGVVAQIVPWNYPAAMASWKIQGCLAAGNCIVIKPAENTSLSLLYMAQLFKKAGFPPGVLNVVPGYGNIAGSALAEHMDIDKIAFTGSTAVGKKIMSMAALSNLKNVTLECGGKSPAVVFKDSNLDEAVKWISMGIFYNSGQNCTANSRILVENSVYDVFIKKFVKYVAENWNISPNIFDKNCQVGPVVSKVQYDRVIGYVNEGKKTLNYKCLNNPETVNECSKRGYFIPPTIFLDVPSTSKLFQEEIFGPVGVITKFSNYDEAVSLANDTSYGLAAAVFSENVRVINQFAKDVRAGTVWCNSSNEEEVSCPFGGYKMSGIGRELGESGMDAYMETKCIHMNISNL
ncbi:probable Aldehyde dehydrogenase [NAD(P)+] 1 [Saccharomycodes ludwigii]|uniref:Probable Aldehyde dehydrogenase [NAD(P)+] 1 n=1 Tax=Saccharomycodes ludwigii TaxID=36035 RepID=A0A376BC46_9ASCO|nr:probable Aldehyde dehydrogenase [NAD(P)+] 1 [Saccharomycodes ludwigii]